MTISSSSSSSQKVVADRGRLLTTISLCLTIVGTEGFRNFAGDCSAGTDALLQPNQILDLQTHGILNQVGGGPISDYNLRMELNGMALDIATPTDFDIDVDHTLSLVAEANSFAGFFIRMEAVDGVETLDAFVPTDELVQLVESCEDPGIAGVSHTSNAPKQSANFTLNMDKVSSGMVLDVTVVIETSIPRNISHWYYSSFILNSVLPEGKPTDSPTTLEPTPAPMPATPEPTPTPSMLPTEEPEESSDESSANSLIGGMTMVCFSLMVSSLSVLFL